MREDAQQAHEVRLALETLAARVAALRRSRLHLAELTSALEVERNAPRSSPDALGARFHQIIARASGNPYLRAMIGNVGTIMRQQGGDQSPVSCSVRDHAELLAAITAGDGERAAKVMAAHLHRLAGATESKRGERSEGP